MSWIDEKNTDQLEAGLMVDAVMISAVKSHARFRMAGFVDGIDRRDLDRRGFDPLAVLKVAI